MLTGGSYLNDRLRQIGLESPNPGPNDDDVFERLRFVRLFLTTKNCSQHNLNKKPVTAPKKQVSINHAYMAGLVNGGDKSIVQERSSVESNGPFGRCGNFIPNGINNNSFS